MGLPMSYAPKSRIGESFDSLVITADFHPGKPIGDGNPRWVTVACLCGNELGVRLSSLVSGNTKSCGCLRGKKITTHGHNLKGKRSPTYSSWSSMIQRCTNPRSDGYATYGAVGIGVCERWLDFEGFLEDMGTRPEGKTLERKKNELGYSLENCEWAEMRQQIVNRKGVTLYDYQGQRMTAGEISRAIGFEPYVIPSRLSQGWTLDRAISTPVTARKPK